MWWDFTACLPRDNEQYNFILPCSVNIFVTQKGFRITFGRLQVNPGQKHQFWLTFLENFTENIFDQPSSLVKIYGRAALTSYNFNVYVQ